MDGLLEQVATQIRQRVRGEKITDRLISLSDPDARPIRKVVGAASGHAGVVKMGEDAGAALVDAASLLGAL